MSKNVPTRKEVEDAMAEAIALLRKGIEEDKASGRITDGLLELEAELDGIENRTFDPGPAPHRK